MSGIAWASCWPVAFQATRENNPIPILLGAICAILPDTLDHWFSKQPHKPDIQIVPPPEAPTPQLIAEALAYSISQSQESGRKLKVALFPIPIGPDQWIPYTIHLDSRHQKLSVTVEGGNSNSSITHIPLRFITDHTTRLLINTEPLSLALAPLSDGRILLKAMPGDQQWSHSLVTALAIGVILAGIWGLTCGCIAGGAYVMHIFVDQWGFKGCALLWPFSQRRNSGYQWMKADTTLAVDRILAWMAFLLIAGNIIHTTATPVIEFPSIIQLLLFGGAAPLAVFTLTKK